MSTQTFTADQLQALFAFPFKDADWKNKFLIGSLIVLAGYIIPIVPFFFIYGYMVHVMRRIIVEQAEPWLPAWDDWGKLLIDGLKLFGVGFIYMLPALILFLIGFLLMFVIPVLGIPFIAILGEENADTAGVIFGIITIVSMVGSTILFGLGHLVMLAIVVVFPAIFGHVVATDEFSAAFRIKEWWAIFRANIGGFLIALIVVLLVNMVLGIAMYLLYFTIILCCLMPLISAPVTMYLTVIYGAIFGQVYRGGVQQLESQANEVAA